MIRFILIDQYFEHNGNADSSGMSVKYNPYFHKIVTIKILCDVIKTNVQYILFYYNNI